jgi:hypothetical protein
MYTIEMHNLPNIDNKDLVKILWNDVEKLLNQNAIMKNNTEYTILDI